MSRQIMELQIKDQELNEQYKKELLETRDVEEYIKKMEEKTERFRTELYKLMNYKWKQ